MSSLILGVGPGGAPTEIAVDAAGRVLVSGAGTDGAQPVEGVPGGEPVLVRGTAQLITPEIPFAAGAALLSATACKTVELYALYTGTSTTGVYLQIHDAASVAAANTDTKRRTYPVDSSAAVAFCVNWEFAAGVVFVLSSSPTAVSPIVTASGLAGITKVVA